MNVRRTLSLLLLALVLAGCRNPYLITQRFEDSSREHNRLMRWQGLEQSCVIFAGDQVKDACLERARAAKDVSVADYRVTSTELDVDKGTATVRVEVDYFILPSTRLKTLVDEQQWRYVEDGEKGNRWFLATPPPEFR